MSPTLTHSSLSCRKACRPLLLFFSLILTFLFAGCDRVETDVPVDQVAIAGGLGQCALPGKEFAQPLRIVLYGPESRSWLGAVNRSPAAGVKVRFVPVGDCDLKFEPAEGVTGVDGSISVRVTAGTRTGDLYLDVIPEDFPGKAIPVRFIVGMEIEGGDQEGAAGEWLDDPLTVRLVNSDGSPAADVPVFFSFNDTPEGSKTKAKLFPAATRTDEHGIAQAQVKLGKKTGEYKINVEVAGQEVQYYIRGTRVSMLGIDVITVVIMVLGGLAIFVFGMKMLGDGLQKIAGEKLKQVLHFFSRNCVIAAIAGAGVTALIQSSSATTVMVIGFINAGLLNLQQAIGIIFGANVGTTITAQIISFNLDAIAIPAIIVGLLGLFSKRLTIQGWGESIFGFGLLFFGLTMMSDQLKILGEFPSFEQFFQLFNCAPEAAGGFMPIGAVLGAIGIGLVMTVIIQSSSAAMGIILALAASNLINFYTAVPLLLGSNIGTTITAWLAAIAANRPAKQAALSHFLFNFIGTAGMIILFYVPWGPERHPIFLAFVNALTPGDAFAAQPQNVARHIAMAHTFFNLINLIVLLPFVRVFVWICNRVIPIRDAVKTVTLEPRLLNTPSIALEQAVHALREMVKDAWTIVQRGTLELFLAPKIDRKLVRELEETEESIDRRQSEITEYLVQITRRPLAAPQSELVPLLMHCVNDAERIGDHCENIIQLTERLVRTDRKLSNTAVKELRRLMEELRFQAESVISALGSTDSETVKAALKIERKITKLGQDFENNHIERLRKGDCSIQVSIIYIEILGELEKVGSKLGNIAERTPEIQKHYIRMR